MCPRGLKSARNDQYKGINGTAKAVPFQNGCARGFFGRLSDTLEGPLDVPYRIPQNDRTAMWTTHGAVGFSEFLQEPLHFILFERHVDLDGGVAGDGGGDVGANVFQIGRSSCGVRVGRS